MGHLRKNLGKLEKNVIVVQFLELYSNVRQNQRLAMLDSRLETLPKRQKEEILNRRHNEAIADSFKDAFDQYHVDSRMKKVQQEQSRQSRQHAYNVL